MTLASECRWCTKRHGARFLCDAAQQILDALYARGMEGNMPTIDLPEPIPGVEMGMGLDPDDRLLSQLVVYAGTVPVAGVLRPLLVFSGRDVQGRALPRWLYAADDEGLRRTSGLVADRAEKAIAAARAGITVEDGPRGSAR